MQKNSYEPAVLNTRLPVAPLARLSVVQVGSDVTVAVCGAVSLLVHVMTSPTLAVTEAGENAKFAIVALTVPVSVDGAHAAPPAAALSDAAGPSLAGASLAGTSLAGAAVAGADAVAPPVHALRTNNMVEQRARIVRDIWTSSWFGAGVRSLGDAGWYAAAGRPVS